MATIINKNSNMAKIKSPLNGFSYRPAQLITHLILLGLGFIYIFPFLWMLASSLKSLSDFFGQGLNLIPNSWHFENYSIAWTVGNFGTYFGNSIFVTFFVVILVNLFSSMAGFVLARTRFPGWRLIVGLVSLTVFLPKGQYNILPIFDLIQVLHLNNTLWSVIIVSTATSLAFSTFLYMGYFRALPREIEEAAVVDGATFPRLYWTMLALAGPIIATVTLFTFINNWNDFFTPLVFTLGKPELRTLAVGMFAFTGEHSSDWTLMCAGAAITILPVILLFVFLQRFFIEGVAGAVK